MQNDSIISATKERNFKKRIEILEEENRELIDALEGAK